MLSRGCLWSCSLCCLLQPDRRKWGFSAAGRTRLTLLRGTLAVIKLTSHVKWYWPLHHGMRKGLGLHGMPEQQMQVGQGFANAASLDLLVAWFAISAKQNIVTSD